MISLGIIKPDTKHQVRVNGCWSSSHPTHGEFDELLLCLYHFTTEAEN